MGQILLSAFHSHRWTLATTDLRNKTHFNKMKRGLNINNLATFTVTRRCRQGEIFPQSLASFSHSADGSNGSIYARRSINSILDFLLENTPMLRHCLNTQTIIKGVNSVHSFKLVTLKVRNPKLSWWLFITGASSDNTKRLLTNRYSGFTWSNFLWIAERPLMTECQILVCDAHVCCLCCVNMPERRSRTFPQNATILIIAMLQSLITAAN